MTPLTSQVDFNLKSTDLWKFSVYFISRWNGWLLTNHDTLIVFDFDIYHGNSDINSLVWTVLWIPTDLWQAINTALGPPSSLYNIHGRNIWWSLTGSSVRISEWGSRCSGPLAQYKPTPPRCPRVRADESRLLLRGKLFSLIVPDVVLGPGKFPECWRRVLPLAVSGSSRQ